MIIIYPTETCYGIGCSINDLKSIKKIYKLKKRDKSKPLIVLVDSIKMWKQIAKVSNKALDIAKKYWPAPLTIIQPKKEIVSDLICKNEVAVRISKNNIVNNLIKTINSPLISTSANVSGKENPYCLNEIDSSIKENVDLIIDKGLLKNNPPSTVIKIKNNEIITLRQGKIKIKS